MTGVDTEIPNICEEKKRFNAYYAQNTVDLQKRTEEVYKDCFENNQKYVDTLTDELKKGSGHISIADFKNNIESFLGKFQGNTVTEDWNCQTTN